MKNITKIMLLEEAVAKAKAWQAEGRKIGFTNGCFDLLHTGHIKSFNYTKGYCDKLVVAVNSDFSVKKLKGESRPVNNEMERALILEALSVTDIVIVFPDETPLRLIEALRPDILAKGADYQKHQVIGHDIVESYGGKILLVPLKEGVSTTKTIARLKN